MESGEQVATDFHDRFPPNGGDCKGNSPAISGKSRLVKYYFIWPDSVLFLFGGRGIYENHILMQPVFVWFFWQNGMI